ncbi:hypothetical protein AKJ16_DCAP03731 [Drosera capensis]
MSVTILTLRQKPLFAPSLLPRIEHQNSQTSFIFIAKHFLITSRHSSGLLHPPPCPLLSVQGSLWSSMVLNC